MDEVKDNPSGTSSVENTGSLAMWEDGKFSVDRSKLDSPDIGWFKRWLLNLEIRNVERVVNSSGNEKDYKNLEETIAFAVGIFRNLVRNQWGLFGIILTIKYANEIFNEITCIIQKPLKENAQKFFEKYQSLPDEIKSNLPIELRNILRNNGKGLLSNDQLKKAEKVVATMQGILQNKWHRHSQANNSWLQQVQLTRCLNRGDRFSEEEIKRIEDNLINVLNTDEKIEVFCENIEHKKTACDDFDSQTAMEISTEHTIVLQNLAIQICNSGKILKTIPFSMEKTFCGVGERDKKRVIIFSIPIPSDSNISINDGNQIGFFTYIIPASKELEQFLMGMNMLDSAQNGGVSSIKNALSKFKIKLDDAAAIGDPQKQNDTPFIYAPGPGAKRATKPKYDYGEVENFLQKNDALPDPNIKRFYIRSSDDKTKFSLCFNNGSLDSVHILRLNNGKLDVSGWLTKIAILNNNDNSDTVTFQCKYRSGGEERTEEITVKKENLLQCKKDKKDATDNPPLDVYLTRNGWFPAKDGNLILKSADGQTQIKIINSVFNPVLVADSKVNLKSPDSHPQCRDFRAYNVVVSNVENDGKQVQLSFKPELNDKGEKIHPDQEEQDIIFNISELENLGKSDKS